MALKDVVALHAVLTEAFDRESGLLSAETLETFERERPPAVETTVDLQQRTVGTIGWLAQNGDLLPPFAMRVLVKTTFALAPLLARDRIEHLLLGDDPPEVARSHFLGEPAEDALKSLRQTGKWNGIRTAFLRHHDLVGSLSWIRRVNLAVHARYIHSVSICPKNVQAACKR